MSFSKLAVLQPKLVCWLKVTQLFPDVQNFCLIKITAYYLTQVILFSMCL